MAGTVSRQGVRWWAALVVLFAGLALVAAACSDDDFDDAPEDRGAAAAEAAGATEAEPEQEAEEEASEAEQAEAEEPEAEEPAAEPDEEDEPEAAEPAVADLPGDPSNGEELFFANGCNVCHGDAGEGGIGPTIAMTGLTLDEVIAQYRDPRGTMPEFPADQVPDADVADIYSWLLTLELPDQIVPGEGTP